MRPLAEMLDELEQAIRAEYATVIAALEAERDAKLAQIRGLAPNGNGRPSAKPPLPAKAKRPVAPPRAAEPAAPKKLRDPDEMPSLGKRIQRAALEQAGNFTIDDIQGADPDFADKGSLIAYHLKNLVARGELRLHEVGVGSKPSTYAPMPLNSLKQAPVPPSKAARPYRSLSEPAAVSA